MGRVMVKGRWWWEQRPQGSSRRSTEASEPAWPGCLRPSWCSLELQAGIMGDCDVAVSLALMGPSGPLQRNADLSAPENQNRVQGAGLNGWKRGLTSPGRTPLLE